MYTLYFTIFTVYTVYIKLYTLYRIFHSVQCKDIMVVVLSSYSKVGLWGHGTMCCIVRCAVRCAMCGVRCGVRCAVRCGVRYAELTAAKDDANTHIPSISTTVLAEDADLPLLFPFVDRLDVSGCTIAK